MVNRTYQTNKSKDIEYYRWIEADVEMSHDDTVTLAEFASNTALKVVTLVNKADLSELTATIANNQVTCTSAGINMRCVLFAAGIRAI